MVKQHKVFMIKMYEPKDVIIASLAVFLCLSVIFAGHQSNNELRQQEPIDFKNEVFGPNTRYTCLSHGDFCTDGEGIYSIYGDPNNPET